MSINVTLFAQMIVFIILVWFTMKYVWPILHGIMQEREKKIADGLAAAEQGQKSLELAQEERGQLIDEGRGKAKETIAQAERRATEIVEEAKVKARDEGARIVHLAHSQIEQERGELRESLRKEVAVLAVHGAEKILMREVDSNAHSDTLDKLASQL